MFRSVNSVPSIRHGNYPVLRWSRRRSTVLVFHWRFCDGSVMVVTALTPEVRFVKMKRSRGCCSSYNRVNATDRHSTTVSFSAIFSNIFLVFLLMLFVKLTGGNWQIILSSDRIRWQVSYCIDSWEMAILFLEFQRRIHLKARFT